MDTSSSNSGCIMKSLYDLRQGNLSELDFLTLKNGILIITEILMILVSYGCWKSKLYMQAASRKSVQEPLTRA